MKRPVPQHARRAGMNDHFRTGITVPTKAAISVVDPTSHLAPFNTMDAHTE